VYLDSVWHVLSAKQMPAVVTTIPVLSLVLQLPVVSFVSENTSSRGVRTAVGMREALGLPWLGCQLISSLMDFQSVSIPGKRDVP
jgi:hypothetical protein